MTETDTSRERIERLLSLGCADYLHMALLARAEKAEDSIENAVQAMAETSPNWEARCHAIMAALGNDFGGYSEDVPDAGSWYEVTTRRLKDELEQTEAERDTAWNEAIEAAAQTQIDKANYWSSLCNDDERCHYEAIAGEIRALRKGDPT